MFKLSNILEVAKEDRFVKQNKRFSIYRFKNEKKLRIDAGSLINSSNVKLFVLKIITMEFTGERWEIKDISDEARSMIFKEALKDAGSLIYAGFYPEIDNLSSPTLGSILFKVLLERDLLDEGELGDINPRTARSWRNKTEAFFRKYRDYLEGEEAREYRIYKDV